MRGKWIRIECDYVADDYYHPDCTLDIADQYSTYKDMMQYVKKYGWKFIKGKWYCSSCIERKNYKKNI